MQRAGFAVAMGLALIANAGPEATEAEDATTSEFVGRYDGNSFETAMGMEILADGTWGWGVSVGALDMRAKGTWRQEGDFIYLTSDPKPVAPAFGVSGLEESHAGRWFRVVWAGNGEPFQYASAIVTCKNGELIGNQVYSEGWPPPESAADDETLSADMPHKVECDEPETVTLSLSMYQIRSERYVLRDLGWEPGTTVRFEFLRNDLGVADFTGVTGYLEDGKLKLVGAEWPLELKKLPVVPAVE